MEYILHYLIFVKNYCSEDHFMEQNYLQVVQFLGEKGYFARTDAEKIILEELIEKGFIQRKKGTKSVYQITTEGQNYLSRELNPNTKITDGEFLELIKAAYHSLRTPMKPLVRIPEVKKKLNNLRIPDSYFNSKLLNLHDKGVLTLHTALSKNYAKQGGIESNSGTGIYYYLMFEA